ncbi:MAG: hypothetical protein NTW46_00085 [Candidatus Nealsonbacteria bacterium]|nr:hypothetical protein [Candidatus Nealsonbacteria bacterium]
MGMLIPQRGFLLGMTLAVWSMFLLLYVILNDKNGKSAKKMLVLSGLLAGLLPIVHMHSFVAVFIITGITCISVLKKWKLFLYYVVPAGILSTFLYLIFIHGGIENPRFFSWFPGWTIKGGFFAWLKMWIYFWSIMLPLALFGLVAYWKKFSAAI